MLTPLHEAVPYVVPFEISADGNQAPKPLIKAFVILDPNPYIGAKERHG